MQPAEFCVNNNKYEVSTWVELIDLLCKVLKKGNAEKFEEFLADEKKRRTRIPYLAKEEQSIHYIKYLQQSDLYLNQKIDAPRSVKLIAKLLSKFSEVPFELYIKENSLKQCNAQ